MTGWAAVAIVAIVVWGIVQLSRNRHRVDRHGKSERNGSESRQWDDPAAKREVEDLRERIKVLERIATEGNSLDAAETKRISAEIEALRDKQAD